MLDFRSQTEGRPHYEFKDVDNIKQNEKQKSSSAGLPTRPRGDLPTSSRKSTTSSSEGKDSRVWSLAGHRLFVESYPEVVYSFTGKVVDDLWREAISVK